MRVVVDTQCGVVRPTMTNELHPISRSCCSKSVPMKALLTFFWINGSPARGCSASLIALPAWLGFNDVWQQFDGKHEGQSLVTLNEYEQTLDELLSNVKTMLKGLILMTPYFIQPRGEPMRTMMDLYGIAVQRLAQKHHAIFVDTQTVFDRAVEFTPIETLAWDGAHLTIAGHMILARAVLQSVDFNWSEA